MPYVPFCGLLCWRHGNKTRAVIIVARFPDNDDLIGRYVAEVTIIVAKMQHAAFDLQHLASQTRRAAAVHIDLLADKS